MFQALLKYMDDLSPEERAELEARFKQLDEFQETKIKELFADMPKELKSQWRNLIPKFYKLDEDHNPIPCSSFEYAMQFETGDKYRRVALTECGPYIVSTVFLAKDHNWPGKNGPILFETMIWSRKQTDHREFFDHQWQYRTWAQALAGHKKVVELVEKGLLP